MIRFLRRIHMYLALFLGPWMLMYALSAMIMNHRPFFNSLYDNGMMHKMEVEQELTYEGQFSDDVTPPQMAQKILADVGLDGPHGQRADWKSKKITTLTIWRDNPVNPRTLTYTPADGKLVIEKRVFRTPQFLVGVHHHKGFQQEYAASDLWAVSLDLVIFAMIFWAISGVLIWIKMPATRRWGAVSIVVGLGVFAFFLLTI